MSETKEPKKTENMDKYEPPLKKRKVDNEKGNDLSKEEEKEAAKTKPLKSSKSKSAKSKPSKTIKPKLKNKKHKSSAKPKKNKNKNGTNKKDNINNNNNNNNKKKKKSNAIASKSPAIQTNVLNKNATAPAIQPNVLDLNTTNAPIMGMGNNSNLPPKISYTMPLFDASGGPPKIPPLNLLLSNQTQQNQLQQQHNNYNYNNNNNNNNALNTILASLVKQQKENTENQTKMGNILDTIVKQQNAIGADMEKLKERFKKEKDDDEIGGGGGGGNNNNIENGIKKDMIKEEMKQSSTKTKGGGSGSGTVCDGKAWYRCFGCREAFNLKPVFLKHIRSMENDQAHIDAGLVCPNENCPDPERTYMSARGMFFFFFFFLFVHEMCEKCAINSPTMFEQCLKTE